VVVVVVVGLCVYGWGSGLGFGVCVWCLYVRVYVYEWVGFYICLYKLGSDLCVRVYMVVFVHVVCLSWKMVLFVPMHAFVLPSRVCVASST
jgi:hypothetical protein